MALDALSDNFKREMNKALDADYEKATIAERDAIPTYVRYPGMQCYVSDDGTGEPALFWLKAQIGDDLSDNLYWEAVGSGSGGGGIELTDLTVGAEGTPSGDGSLAYDNTTGVFTYTPPDLSSYAQGDFIPLSGTEVGSPVTGDIEMQIPSTFESKIFNSITNFSNTQDEFNSIGFRVLDNFNNEGFIGVYNQESSYPYISFTNTVSEYFSALILESTQRISIDSTDPAFKGIDGENYYGANYTDNTYVQKKYVDDNFLTSSDIPAAQNLQSVLDEGAYASITYPLQIELDNSLEPSDSIQISASAFSVESLFLLNNSQINLRNELTTDSDYSELYINSNYIEMVGSEGGLNVKRFRVSSDSGIDYFQYTLNNVDLRMYIDALTADRDLRWGNFNHDFRSPTTGDVFTFDGTNAGWAAPSGGTDTNDYLDGATFNTANGELTLTVGAQADVVVDLDGRYLTDYTVTEADVLAHEAALTITESQISDLSHFLPSTLLADYGFTDNSTNWNTAFGWGDHAAGGYLTSFTETDPVFTASPAGGILAGDITNWDNAFGWGDHALAGYITGYTVTEVDVLAHEAALTITESQISDLTHYDSSDFFIDLSASTLQTLLDIPVYPTGTNREYFLVWDDAGPVSFSWQEAAAFVLANERNDLTASVIWANIPDAFVPSSAVTQHEGDLLITKSQITDFTVLKGTKTSDQDITSNTTFVDDAEVRVSITPPVSGVDYYSFECLVVVQSAASIALKLQFNTSNLAGSAAEIAALHGLGNTSVGLATNIVATFSGTRIFRFYGTFAVPDTATAGDLFLRWAQNVSNANITRMRQSSYLRIEKH